MQASGELSGNSNSASLSALEKPSDSQGQAESSAQQQQQAPQLTAAGPSNLVRCRPESFLRGASQQPCKSKPSRQSLVQKSEAVTEVASIKHMHTASSL